MELNLIRQSELWPHSLPDLRQIIETSFKHTNIDPADKSIAIVLSDDAQVHVMNRDYRGKDKATNVLSFPASEDEDIEDAEPPEEWGDLVFAYETIAREASEQGKSFDDHFAHLLVHGTLHLLGHDHIETKEAEQMEQIEITILSELSIENPYKNDYTQIND